MKGTPVVASSPLQRVAGLVRRDPYPFIAIAMALVSTMIVLKVIAKFSIPPGGDGGQWLSVANSIMGEGVSRLGKLAYPPLYFFLLIICLTLFSDPLVAIYASLAVVVFLLPVSAFFSYRLVTRDQKGALVASILIVLNFTMLDMLAWGGYPSLLSFSFLMPALALLVSSFRPEATRRQFLLLGLFSALTCLTHPLSALMLAVSGGLFVLFRQFHHRSFGWFKDAIRFSLPLFLVLYLPYLALQFTPSSSLPNYLIDLPVYSLGLLYYPLVPAPLRGIFPFDYRFSVLLTAVIVIIASHSLPDVVIRKRLSPVLAWLLRPLGRENAVNSYLLFVATIVPVVLTPVLMWAAGKNTDFARFLYYAPIPLACLGGALFSRFVSKKTASSIAAVVTGTAAMLTHRSRNRKPPRAPGRVSRQASRTVFAGLLTGSVVCLMAFTAFGVAYLAGSTNYYVTFYDQEDRDLARWLRENTNPDSLVVLSPDARNERAFRWLEGLSGRKTMGYTTPRYLFYERELETNYDVYQMFHHRLAVNSGAVEVAARTIGDSEAFQFRTSIIDRRAPYPVMNFDDPGSRVIFDDGGGMQFNEFIDRQTIPGTDPGGTVSILQRAYKDFPPVVLERTARVSGGQAEIEFKLISPERRATGYELNLLPAGQFCRLEIVDGGIELTVRTDRGSCLKVRISGSQGLDAKRVDWMYRVRMGADATGSASIRFESVDAVSGIGPVQSLFDSAELFQKYGADYVVLRSDNGDWMGDLNLNYHFPKVYENPHYLVYRALPGLEPHDQGLLDWFKGSAMPGEGVGFGPGSERSAVLDRVKKEVGLQVVTTGDPLVPDGPLGDGTLLYQMLNHRYTISQGSLIMGSYGAPGQGAGMRASVVSGGVAFPAFELLDNRTFFRDSRGSEIVFDSLRSGTMDFSDSTSGPEIRYNLSDSSPPVEISRRVKPWGNALRVEFEARGEVNNYGMAAVMLHSRCSLEFGDDYVDWGVWAGGRCVTFRLWGGPYFESFSVADVVLVGFWLDSDGSSELVIEPIGPDGHSGSSPIGRDIAALYEQLNLRHMVFSTQVADAYESRLTQWFGFNRTFENSEYTVFSR